MSFCDCECHCHHKSKATSRLEYEEMIREKQREFLREKVRLEIEYLEKTIKQQEAQNAILDAANRKIERVLNLYRNRISRSDVPNNAKPEPILYQILKKIK